MKIKKKFIKKIKFIKLIPNMEFNKQNIENNIKILIL